VQRDITYLLLQAGQGNADAFDEVVRQTQHEVLRFAQSLIGPNEAGDVAQDTFLRAWRSAPTFTGSASGRTWLFGVARNVVADHQRRHARRTRIRKFVSFSSQGKHRLNTVDLNATEVEPSDNHRFEEYSALQVLVDLLEPERKEAFVLTQILGLSYAEVAEICGVPIGTIRSRVARARGALVMAYLAEEHDKNPSESHHG
jgi:RNA polymerase sigma-70 factor, ECF subfamily